MNKTRKRRLYLILTLCLGTGLAVGLSLYALRQNINLFYSPSQIWASQAPLQHSIRIGGLVEKGSVNYAKHGLQVNFKLSDKVHDIVVQYAGVLPDLFREGQGIVAEGKLASKHLFVASNILAKHDATYMPPEVASALKAAHGSSTVKAMES